MWSGQLWDDSISELEGCDVRICKTNNGRVGHKGRTKKGKKENFQEKPTNNEICTKK